jgi:hypothetical protein
MILHHLKSLGLYVVNSHNRHANQIGAMARKLKALMLSLEGEQCVVVIAVFEAEMTCSKSISELSR